MKPVLLLESVVKRYGGRRILDGVALVLDQPGTTALLGANGSGKSTLLRIVAGVSEADAGRVLIDGTPIAHPSARRRLGFVPEAADPLPESTVAELVALCAAVKVAPLPAEALRDRLGASAFYGQRIGTLSLGQRRRACLLAALVGPPSLLVLDEPTNGLDPAGVTLLADLLREHTQRGGVALVATHDLEFADLVGARRARLVDGRIAA